MRGRDKLLTSDFFFFNQVDSSKETNSSDTQKKASASGGPSRLGRFRSQLFEKALGLVSRSRPDRQVYEITFPLKIIFVLLHLDHLFFTIFFWRLNWVRRINSIMMKSLSDGLKKALNLLRRRPRYHLHQQLHLFRMECKITTWEMHQKLEDFIQMRG